MWAFCLFFMLVSSGVHTIGDTFGTGTGIFLLPQFVKDEVAF